MTLHRTGIALADGLEHRLDDPSTEGAGWRGWRTLALALAALAILALVAL
jgi:hypothetical protein